MPTITGPFGVNEASMEAIHWDKIILAGWSQGSGHAALIALEHQVAGLFLLEGPSDMCLEDPLNGFSGVPSTYYSALVDGVLEPSSAAPRFGVWHTESDSPLGSSDARPPSWDNDYPDHLGPLAGLRMLECDDQAWDLTVSEAEVAVNGAGVPPLKVSRFNQSGTETQAYRSMTLVTSQADVTGTVCGPHESVALSSRNGVNCMPTDATSGDAATRADETHVFEAYVRAFCEMDHQ